MMRNFWNKHKQTLSIALALAAMMLAVIMAQAATSPPKTVAEVPAESEVTFDMEQNTVYTAEDGIVVIPAAVKPQSETAAEASPLPAVADVPEPELLTAVAPVKSSSYTLPEQAQMKNGSIGVLSIPKIGLSVNVYESDDEMEAMTKGLAHFKTTSAFDGNTGLCGHNINFDDSAGYFYNLHKLVVGDTISYKTALGQRNYTVETVKEIAETDWSYLGRTEDNRVTLITCITGKTTMRLMVQAVEKSS